MRPFDVIVAALIGFAASGCALEPGDPWGVVRAGLEVRLDLSGGRLDPEGRVRTSDDYRVQLQALELEIEAVEFVAGETSALSFDPANPPPGYSLCHNGHCHADDGRLVDYADIAAELAGGAASGPALVLGGGVVTLDASMPAAGLVLEACSNACVLDNPGELAAVRALVRGARVRGRVFDARTGAAARLPVEGVAFDVALGSGDDAGASWRPGVTLGARFGPGRQAGLEVDLGLVLSPTAFDALPWDDGALLEASMSASFERELRLVIDGTARFDP